MNGQRIRADGVRALLLALALHTSSPLARDALQPAMSEALVARLDEAREARRSGDLRRAMTTLHEILRVEPTYYNALLNLGLAQFADRQIPLSLETFERALQVRATEGIEDYHVFNTIGWIYLEHGDFDNAERYLKQAVDNAGLNSRRINRVAFNNLGLLYLYRNSLEEARKNFEIAARVYGNSSAERNLDLVTEARQEQPEIASRTLGAGRWTLLKQHIAWSARHGAELPDAIGPGNVEDVRERLLSVQEKGSTGYLELAEVPGEVLVAAVRAVINDPLASEQHSGDGAG